MCLAVPGKVIELRDDEAGVRMGRVSFGGVTKEVCFAYLPEASVGDYVLVHVGFALNRIDEQEARRVFELLDAASDLHEARTDPSSGEGGEGVW